MSSLLAEIVALLDIAPSGEGSFVAQHAESASTYGHVFGGLVAAQATVAACRTVELTRPMHSLHAYFLRPGDPAQPIQLEVESTRDGRSFSHRRVSAIQHGRAIMEMSCSFASPEPGLHHQVSMPSVPEPEELQSDWMLLAALPGTVPQLVAAGPFDVRSAEDHSRTSDLTVLDPVTRPHALSLSAEDVQPATIDHAVWFHRPTRADEWWLCDVDSPWAGDGRGYARGRIFDRRGLLVAEIAQEGLIRLP